MNKHVKQHHLHQELEEYGVSPIDENLKIKWFQDGIKDPQYEAVRTTVSIDPSWFPTFDSPVQPFRTVTRPLPVTAAVCPQSTSAVAIIPVTLDVAGVTAATGTALLASPPKLRLTDALTLRPNVIPAVNTCFLPPLRDISTGN